MLDGAREVKLLLPNQRSYNLEIFINLHYFQIYYDIAERFRWNIKDLVLRQNETIRKPIDLIEDNYDPITEDFITLKDINPEFDFPDDLADERSLSAIPYPKTFNIKYNGKNEAIEINRFARVNDILMKFGLSIGMKSAHMKLKIVKNGTT